MSNGVFTSIQEQIQRLRNDCNIIINDEKKAAMILKTVGYSWLLDTYGNFFKVEGENRKFIDGTKIEDLYANYQFDLDLKEYIFPYLLRIELHVKALLGYYFPKMYTYKENEYLSPGKYNNGEKAVGIIEEALSNYKYNKNVPQETNVPLWDLVNSFTCGELANFFECLKHDLRRQVCAEYLTIEENTMGEMLYILNAFRNATAHDEPLFNKSIYSRINDPKLGWEIGAPHTFYDCVQTIVYLSNTEDTDQFVNTLNKKLTDFDKQINHNVYIKIFQAMGFPKSWLSKLKDEKQPLDYYRNNRIDNEMGTVNAMAKPVREVKNSKTKKALEKQRARSRKH